MCGYWGYAAFAQLTEEHISSPLLSIITKLCTWSFTYGDSHGLTVTKSIMFIRAYQSKTAQPPPLILLEMFSRVLEKCTCFLHIFSESLLDCKWTCNVRAANCIPRLQRNNKNLTCKWHNKKDLTCINR